MKQHESWIRTRDTILETVANHPGVRQNALVRYLVDEYGHPTLLWQSTIRALQHHGDLRVSLDRLYMAQLYVADEPPAPSSPDHEVDPPIPSAGEAR